MRLFTTLARFDAVYHGHFKCNRNKLTEMPALWGYARDLFQTPGFGETIDFDQIKAHYYVVHTDVNPSGIVPKGPDPEVWLTPHGRDRAQPRCVEGPEPWAVVVGPSAAGPRTIRRLGLRGPVQATRLKSDGHAAVRARRPRTPKPCRNMTVAAAPAGEAPRRRARRCRCASGSRSVPPSRRVREALRAPPLGAVAAGLEVAGGREQHVAVTAPHHGRVLHHPVRAQDLDALRVAAVATGGSAGPRPFSWTTRIEDGRLWVLYSRCREPSRCRRTARGRSLRRRAGRTCGSRTDVVRRAGLGPPRADERAAADRPELAERGRRDRDPRCTTVGTQAEHRC